MYFHANISETRLGVDIFSYLPTYIKTHTKDLKAENEELIKIQSNYFCFRNQNTSSFYIEGVSFVFNALVYKILVKGGVG